MIHEPDTTTDILRRYCKPAIYQRSSGCLVDKLGIPWKTVYKPAEETIIDHPTVVLSPTYKSTLDCNYAVCYGVRILTPSYLPALIGAVDSSWKKIADSQDSFSLPDENNFLPTLDPKLPNTRNDVAVWLPDPDRQNLYKGWTILALKSAVVSSSRASWHILADTIGSNRKEMDQIHGCRLARNQYS